MHCPFCKHPESKVTDSRDSQDGQTVRRRRECEKCGERFTTYEHIEEILPAVIKKDGRREPFDRTKILEGMRKACEKRPISVATIESCADKVVQWVQELNAPEIESGKIGEKVMSLLHELDEVAYVRFASVYRSFRDINEFMKELGEILRKQNK